MSFPEHPATATGSSPRPKPEDPRCVCCFFNDTATTEIDTLSLHDALPIYEPVPWATVVWPNPSPMRRPSTRLVDRKSTRLNSSHEWISYAVFCLKKKKIKIADDNVKNTRISTDLQ